MCHEGCVSGARHHGASRLHGGVRRGIAAVAEQDSENIADIGVLLEPMSVVEKGIDHAFLLQRRLDWKPKTGPRAGRRSDRSAGRGRAARARARDARRRPRAGDGSSVPSLRRRWARNITRSQQTLVRCEEGDAAHRHRDRSDRRRERRLRRHADPRPQWCAVPAERHRRIENADQPIEKINQQLVLGNQVVFGSVNANPRHFAMGVKDFTVHRNEMAGLLKQLITTRLPWDLNNWSAAGIRDQDDAGNRSTFFSIGVSWLQPENDRPPHECGAAHPSACEPELTVTEHGWLADGSLAPALGQATGVSFFSSSTPLDLLQSTALLETRLIPNPNPQPLTAHFCATSTTSTPAASTHAPTSCTVLPHGLL